MTFYSLCEYLKHNLIKATPYCWGNDFAVTHTV